MYVLIPWFLSPSLVNNVILKCTINITQNIFGVSCTDATLVINWSYKIPILWTITSSLGSSNIQYLNSFNQIHIFNQSTKPFSFPFLLYLSFFLSWANYTITKTSLSSSKYLLFAPPKYLLLAPPNNFNASTGKFQIIQLSRTKSHTFKKLRFQLN